MIVKSKLNIFLTNFYVFNSIKLYNLNKNLEEDLPVYYFTELLAEALGVKDEVKKQ